jgi:phosphoglycerate dehydrogenase-like enzyme
MTRKPKVVSYMPLKRFQDASVALPPQLDFCFETGSSEGKIIHACQGADFLFLPAAYPPITRRILETLSSIRLVQSAGAGYDMVDVESAAGLGIPVANAPGHNAMAVAEFTMALLVSLQRRIVLSDREIKAGNYAGFRETLFRSGLAEVRDTELGLIGLGAIGREVARIAGLLGAMVSYHDVARRPELEGELQLRYKEFEEILLSSDAVSLHVPLSPATRNLIGRAQLSLMQPTALLINTSRGEIVDQQALADALEQGKLGGAALDTVWPEPPPADHPLLNISPAAKDRLLITPHIAGITKNSFSRILRAALENILRVVEGKPPQNVVNSASLP